MIQEQEIKDAYINIESYYEFASVPVEATLHTDTGMRNVYVIDLYLSDEVTIAFRCVELTKEFPSGNIEDHEMFLVYYDFIEDEEKVRELFKHFHDSYWDIFDI